MKFKVPPSAHSGFSFKLWFKKKKKKKTKTQREKEGESCVGLCDEVENILDIATFFRVSLLASRKYAWVKNSGRQASVVNKK